MKASRLRRGMNLWPPFLFAGIRVVELSDDYRHAKVRMRMHWWNRNYVGTHFGGSLFAMTDPFWMLLVLHHLGREHLVWDRAGEIEFVKPGRGTVHAEFHLTDEQLDDVRSQAATNGKALVWFSTDVLNSAGEVVARTRKQVYARRKNRNSLDAEAAETV